jgi:subtilisin family serine protease
MAMPACLSGVVAVGATFDSDLGREPDSGTYQDVFGGSWPACANDTTNLQTITCFTNSNSVMDIVAPGARITASGMGGGTSTYMGTSQASPTAAGIAALMLQASPGLSPATIEATLKSTGTSVTDAKNGLSFPLINALAAVNAVNTTFTDVPSTYWAYDYIERLYAAGITSGCSTSPMMFCPLAPVTRAQMPSHLREDNAISPGGHRTS